MALPYGLILPIFFINLSIMRLLEIMFLGSLLWTIYLLFGKDKKLFLYSLIGSLIFCLFHFILESFRWQMVPAYLLFIILFIVFKSRVRTSLLLKSFLFILLLLSILLPVVAPVFSLPSPTGPHSIGTQIFQWTDSTRLEWFTKENLSDYRKILVQVWYPSQKPEKEKPEPYIDHIDIRAKTIGNAGGFPGELISHINLVKTHSFLNIDPDLSQSPYPLLVLSHGITGMRQIHTTLIEELTSHGYVVVALDHPYDCNLTVFQDGTIADYRSDITGHPDSVSIRRNQLDTRVADVGFVLDKLTELSTASVFGGMMNLNKVGVLGHSYGGATAVQVSYEDDRFSSCLVLDSWMNPLPNNIIKSGTHHPFLCLGRPHWGDSDYPSSPELVKLFMNTFSEHNYHFILKGSRHLDFCDAPLFTPLSSWFVETGSIPAKKAISVTNSIVLSFFDHFMKEKLNEFPNNLLSEPYIIFR